MLRRFFVNRFVGDCEYALGARASIQARVVLQTLPGRPVKDINDPANPAI